MGKISSYESGTPNADVDIIGVDTSDTSMAPTGTTKKYGIDDILTSGLPVESSDITVTKESGSPGSILLYEGTTTETNGTGFIGPDSASGNLYLKLPSGTITEGDLLSFGESSTETIGGVSSTVVPIIPISSAPTDVTVQADDPTSASAVGFYMATTSGDAFYKSSAGLFNISAGTYTEDPTAPSVVSITVGTNGTTVTFVFDKNTSIGAGGSTGMTLNTPTSALTYSSGGGSTSLVFTSASTILSTDTPTSSYVQPGNGLEGTSGGVDLASFSNHAVTNNSTQGGDLVTDNFTDTNSTALSSHTSDSAHTWTQNNGGTMIIYNNRCESSQSTSQGFYYSSYVPSSADYTVSADVMAAGSGVPVFVAGRCSTSAVTMYGCRWNGSTTWELTKWVSGTRTVIGSYAGDTPVDTLRSVELIMSGTTISFKIGGVERISVTDSSISAAGRPGIGSWYCDVPPSHNLYIDNYAVY